MSKPFILDSKKIVKSFHLKNVNKQPIELNDYQPEKTF